MHRSKNDGRSLLAIYRMVRFLLSFTKKGADPLGIAEHAGEGPTPLEATPRPAFLNQLPAMHLYLRADET